MIRQVEIIQRKTVFEQFIFRIEELELRHENFDGSMGPPLKRLVLERGEAAAVLLHDPQTDLLLLCEQFRAATMSYGSGWLIELPAGMLDDRETAQACAQREAKEETGQDAGMMTRVATVYPSPGGSSERIHVFYSSVSLRKDLPEHGGLANEGEDIRTVLLPVGEALAQLHKGEVEDAKTLIALQWLEMQMRDGKHRN